MVREIPAEIKEKYEKGRVVSFDGEPVGVVKEIVGFGETVDTREYVNIVEKIKLDSGGTLFRFAYWTRKTGKFAWTWGQFCLCLKRRQIVELYELMKQRGWIS